MPTETSRPDTNAVATDTREPWVAPVVSLVDTERAAGGAGGGSDYGTPGS